MTSVAVLVARVSAVAALTVTLSASGQSGGQWKQRELDSERVRVLKDIAANRAVLAIEKSHELLRASLTDADVEIRLCAIYAVAARAGGIRFDRSVEARARWEDEREGLQGLRPLIITALRDPDAAVRRGAVIALGNSDFTPGEPTARLRLSHAPQAVLSGAYAGEPSSAVRAEIVKGFALSPQRTETGDRLLVDALSDPSPRVLRFAVIGVGEHHIDSAIPSVLGLLFHGSRSVRLNAGKVLAVNPAIAAPFVSEIRRAADSESDGLVRRTLFGALQVIAQGQP